MTEEDAQGKSTHSRTSPSILVYEVYLQKDMYLQKGRPVEKQEPHGSEVRTREPRQHLTL